MESKKWRDLLFEKAWMETIDEYGEKYSDVYVHELNRIEGDVKLAREEMKLSINECALILRYSFFCSFGDDLSHEDAVAIMVYFLD